ncbi:MAG: argininosuccinate lyase [Chitinispirillaceae bacterium]|jgi:argininosuccinate lyase|nr:argininosuccinate lyase [Chitinispirillaceae bacterium]
MKMWSGRFKKDADRLMDAFNNSLPFDKALFQEDIAGSIAWARSLGRIGVLSSGECRKIESGLASISRDFQAGKIKFLSTDEDIHMAVERLLTTRIGAAGAKLHTGRSRNDQVVTDVRLFVMRELSDISASLNDLQRALIGRAEKDSNIIVPAYTHLQQAQPMLLAHYWLSFFFILEREKKRISNARASSDMMPLGSGAVTGSGFAVDRTQLANELGFSAVSPNSVDGVASRDFLLETLAAVSSVGITLSRYAEDLIIWSSKEFGFVELDDAWSSGSSMMPQKKNPDPLELIRGKSGRFLGNYTRLAVTMKGVGLAYCKDLQEDKEPLFDSIAQIKQVISVFASVLDTLAINHNKITGNMDPFLPATDLADYLVRKALPFREAHAVVGKIVGYCIEKKISFTELPLPSLKSFSPLFGADVRKIFSPEHALSQREISGGTGRKSVARQLALAKKLLK